MQIGGLVVFGLTTWAVMGAVAVVVIDRVRSVREKLMGAWIVPLTPRHERATVLSTLSQADAVSQVMIGPVVGAIGRSAGVPAALLFSAAALTPTVPILAVAGRTDAAAAEPTAESRSLVV